MSWDFKNDNQGDSKKMEFTRLPEGITRVRVVGLEPHIRWNHWLNALKKSINCAGKGCAICEVRNRQKENNETPSYNMARRFSIWVINRETGKLEVLEQGVTFFEDLRDIMEELADEGKTLRDVDLKIRRKGEKTNTTYRISVDTESPLSESDEKLMEEMFDLSEYFKPSTLEQAMAIVNGSTWEEVMEMGKNNDDNEDKDIELK